jgi:excisionase family DNA binding protein
MHSPSTTHTPRSGARPGRSAGPTAALFVRIPAEHARRLDRAAFALRVPKQSLVAELVERYVNPDSPASLMALGRGWGTKAEAPVQRGGAEAAVRQGAAEAAVQCSAAVPGTGDGGRRVTVETLDRGELTVGHHSFRPRDPEVLTPQEAAELLRVDPDVVLELARAGELPGRELGGQWRFARAALLAWLATGAADGGAKG